MLLASVFSGLSQIAHPFDVAFAWLMAGFYSFIPNYAVAIALLTLVTMLVVFPITRRSTRSMMKMQLLAPEMKKLQAKYKSPPGTPPADRNANRQALNEEMMALYKENNVSPAGGCLPMLLQFPIFWILYDTIEGLTHTVHTVKGVVADPLYIGHTTRMYHDIIHAHGKLMSFGINLANDAMTHGLSTWGRAPYIALILIALVFQYIQLKQMSGRNPAAQQANPQMQTMQKVMPLIFAVIYIRIASGVNVYFIVSSLFRIVQQEYMYRHDPELRGSLEKLRARAAEDPKVAEAKKKITAERRGRGGLLARFLPAAALTPDEPPAGRDRPAAGDGKRETASAGKGQGPRPPRGAAGGSAGGQGRPRPSNGGRPRSGGAATGARPTGSAAPAGSGQRAQQSRSQPRAQGKRQRRPR